MEILSPASSASPFLRCVLEGDIQALQLLFENEQHEQAQQLLSEQDLLGRNPLFLACILGRTDVVKELVKRGADVNQQTARGYLPLHCAAAWGQLEVLKTLVELGTDITAVNFQGEKACQVASRYNKTECIDFLNWDEAKHALKTYISFIQQTMADPERVHVKLLKDEKVQVNKACKAKTEWLEHTKNPTTQDFIEQKSQLEAAVQVVLTKLNTPSKQES
ncbi:ankyrin repeat domain-containing protein 45 isoform X2 [Spea bombifrons]|uniref:ankyrin repeat domain-containing protein 45 isoform X2 n=1 Tax=Spea bombifrons TaxID=233779 RepID=UPI00234B256D|nr:ankyrin repeat domain-containing protein 45 isoform X2 [Spea bombifrons]